MVVRAEEAGTTAVTGSATDLVAEARRIYEAQRARRRETGAPAAGERIARLERLRDAIVARRGELAAAMHADFRKHPAESELTEIQQVLGEIKHALRHVRRWMRPTRAKTPLVLAGTRSEIRYEPKGVVLILSPWNYPVRLLLGPLVGAVAAGNSVILRPSEKVPHTARVLARIVADAFREDEVALLTGEVEVAEALLALPFDHVFFTGSAAVGRRVMRAAAEHLCSVTLELGGKSPALVDASADVALAAERIVWGKFINAGQTCVAPDYVVVHESRAAEFLAAAKRTLARFYGETEEARWACDSFCRVIDDRAFQRLSTLLHGSVQAGARLEAGGRTDAAERYIAPTLLSGVSWEMPVMEEEIFGPILPVLTFRSLDEVLERINARPKPLALYVFARGRPVVERVLGGTPAGGTVVNHAVIHLGSPELPFGGVGESGQGSYHGWFGFRTFSHERAVLVQGRWSALRFFYPPYSEKVQRMVERLGRIIG